MMKHWTVGNWILTCFCCRPDYVQCECYFAKWCNTVDEDPVRVSPENRTKEAGRQCLRRWTDAQKTSRGDETQDRGGEPRLPPTDVSNHQRAREHDEQSRQNLDSIADQCRDILIGWLSNLKKADDDDFKPQDEKDLVEKACTSHCDQCDAQKGEKAAAEQGKE